MSGLTDEDREALGEAISTGWHDGGMYGRADFDPRWLDGLASVTAADVADAVEQIVARHVAAALNTAADEIESVARDSREAAEFASGPGAEARHRTRSSGLRAAARIVRRRAQAD